MKSLTLFALLSGVVSLPAVAQDPHAGHKTAPPAQASPAPVAPADPQADQPRPGTTSSSSEEVDPDDAHAQHAMPSPEVDDSAAKLLTGAELTVGNEPPPAIIRDSAADSFYDSAPMSRARGILNDEHGGEPNSKVMGNVLEYTNADDDDGYRWDVEAWYGGDVHRMVLKTEGKGFQQGGVELAETQALYSRAVGRYTDVQAGVRFDLEPRGRAYATIAIESLLPYWFEVEAAFFVSDRGDAFGRLEGTYDLRLTQRLILQPRVEMELAAQDVPDAHIGSGMSSAEVGLRLRFDIRREFAPYIGVNFEKSFGQTADLARVAGEDSENTSFVIGLRAWF
jgi:copper resistance protein B